MLDMIDLELTQKSGQTSQSPWKLIDNSYCDVVLVDNSPILFKYSLDGDFTYELPLNPDFKVDEKLINAKFREIFDLDFDLNKFYSYLKDNSELADIPNFCNGLRLFLAKDPFEAIVSSISSSNNSIARWTKSMDLVKEKWGKSYEFPSGKFYSFPDQNVLSNAFLDEEDEFKLNNNISDIKKCSNNLKSCGVGYRNKYIKKASEFFTLEMDLLDFYKMSYDEAFKTILEVPGVGPKVADCILLYGFNFKQAFPTDVWIKRIVSYLYFDNKDISVSKIRDFGIDEFGDYAGYVQLYLFHYARKSGLLKKLK